jgi:hypothetical protein
MVRSFSAFGRAPANGADSGSAQSPAARGRFRSLSERTHRKIDKFRIDAQLQDVANAQHIRGDTAMDRISASPGER